jgi:hypothetical protein
MNLFFDQIVHALTRPELVELGAPKMKGQFLVSGPMLDFVKRLIKNPTKQICWIMWKSEQLYVGLCLIRWIMLDLLNWLGFLALRPLHMGKLAPVIILL